MFTYSAKNPNSRVHTQLGNQFYENNYYKSLKIFRDSITLRILCNTRF